jgi:hypothetical protein
MRRSGAELVAAVDLDCGPFACGEFRVLGCNLSENARLATTKSLTKVALGVRIIGQGRSFASAPRNAAPVEFHHQATTVNLFLPDPKNSARSNTIRGLQPVCCQRAIDRARGPHGDSREGPPVPLGLSFGVS